MNNEIVLVNFYYDGKLLGGYTMHGTDHRELVQWLSDLSDEYNVARTDIKVKLETRKL